MYGTVVVMATLTAAYASTKDPWKVAAIVWTTSFVLWIAHVYSHGLSESLERERRLDRTELLSVARRERGVVFSGVGPSIALVLGAAGVLRESTSVWIAIGIGLLDHHNVGILLVGEGAGHRLTGLQGDRIG